MNYYTKEVIGLGSAEALKILHDELEKELSHCKCTSRSRSGICVWLSESFYHSSVSSTFRWPSILLTAFTLIVFIINYGYSKEHSLLLQSLILLFFLIFNVLLTAWDTWMRHQELHNKCRLLSKKIKNCSERSQLINEWKTGKYYPNLYLPQSPCITLQWTYRDNQRVNLPTSLLVKGDVILMCPGHAAPGLCKSLEQINAPNEGEPSYLELKRGGRLGSTVEQGPMSFTGARLRKAAKPIKFVMLETPYISGLRLALDQSWHRPATLYEKERHTIITKYIERIIIPLVWLVVFTVSIIHYGYSSGYKVNVFAESFFVLLLRPTSCLLPLLPLTLPSLWLVVNAFGVAHLFNLIKSRPMVKESGNANFSLGSPGSYCGRDDATVSGNINVDLAASSGSAGYEPGNVDGDNVKLKRQADPFFVDLDSNSSIDLSTPIRLTWSELYKTVVDLLTCRDGNLWRSANILQIFGSITALCCVDKKGILSWPNPSADKVFFLTSNSNKHGSSIETNPDYLIDDNDDDIFVDEVSYRNSKNNESVKDSSSKANKKDKYVSKAEVLDITHDIYNSFGLQFDDPEWPRFLPNLKPLGLAILLNTCNMDAQEEYNLFCDHITCESMRNEASVPVINKRCLCELSRIMGFTEKAITDYRYMFQISSFRHVKPEVIQQGKLAQLNFPRLKMPFPNMTSAVIRDICTGSYQLFSQGNGDFILDACTEFWDGQDLCGLTEPDRKRILDFYHRSSLAAYCMAFSYVPLNTCPDRRLNNDFFIELPPDSRHVFQSQKNLNSSVRSWEARDTNCARPLASHHLSTDSLTTKEEKAEQVDEPNGAQNANYTRSKSASSTASVDGYHFESLINQLTNQVFIGMVTMQYQACPDFVTLVEQLDKACIRFVHFSKENELRSRVFSEKMGLEAGWNCHISLLSETASKEINMNASQSHVNSFKGSKVSIHPNSEPNVALVRTQSAPSYFNTDPSTVRFDKSPLKEQSSSIIITTEEDNNIESDRNKIEPLDNDEHLNPTGSRTHNGGKENFMMESDSEDCRSKSWSEVSTSPSHITESTNTERSAPITFDVANRAKLPKGIEQIRPHLKEVDNVPLLVSLFTDCTPQTTREMIEIMQENGEVVCVIGSAANVHNIPIFLQTDASIGIEPLYPQICVREPVTKASGKPYKGFISPTDISNQLNTLPCSICFHREDSISINRIIMEARHYMMNARNCLQFFFSCSLSLSLAQLFGFLFFLPPLLSPGSVLWLVTIIFPLLSLSLMGTPLDTQVMNQATGKNLNLSRESIIYFLMCYLIKFCPSTMIVVTSFALIINDACKKSIGEDTKSSGPCWMLIDANVTLSGADKLNNPVLMAQTFSVVCIVIYFTIISIGFVHRSHLLWRRSPFANRCWAFMSIILLIINLLFCLAQVYLSHDTPLFLSEYLSTIPPYVFILAFLWPIALIIINSLVKGHEIKISERQQRRARLEFGTKLGMNSPF
ncbi:transmembrane protein 94 [Tetranychus urticae]|uniref:transmembrane protein 94 n=1 Tax=Tetranychus urticae TaxID=32264 RepID=UPI00077BCB76|nr:transmembrane protein 94 [Tetranychus urticae]XP_015786073.1 transmembrane protein 94 [Tetranychus urticae]XP_025016922.1 transmembrane protein 94 [Tetranychus urticae]